jgi:hypothetical protein
MTEQKVLVNKIAQCCGVCCVAIDRQYRREFSSRVAPSRDTNYGIIEQFEERGSVCVCVCVRAINVRRDVKSFILRLPKFHNLLEHHVENVLM